MTRRHEHYWHPVAQPEWAITREMAESPLLNAYPARITVICDCGAVELQ